MSNIWGGSGGTLAPPPPPPPPPFAAPVSASGKLLEFNLQSFGLQMFSIHLWLILLFCRYVSSSPFCAWCATFRISHKLFEAKCYLSYTASGLTVHSASNILAMCGKFYGCSYYVYDVQHLEYHTGCNCLKPSVAFKVHGSFDILW